MERRDPITGRNVGACAVDFIDRVIHNAASPAPCHARECQGRGARSGLSSPRESLNLPQCRSTNFIAKSATKTAKSWCVRASGKARHARIAARKSWSKNSPSLLPQPAANAPAPPPPVRVQDPAHVAVAAAAARIGTKLLESGFFRASRDSGFGFRAHLRNRA